MKLSRSEPKKNTNKFVIILVLVLLSGISILAYKNGIDFLKTNNFINNKIRTDKETVCEISLNSDNNAKFIPYNNKILCINNNKIKALNLNKKSEWKIDIDLLRPCVKVNDKYLLIADKNGKQIYLYKANEKIWDKTVNGLIQKVKLNKSGHALVFIKTKSKRKTVIFNLEGERIFYKSYSNQEYLINADIALSNDQVVVLSATTEEGKVSSKVDFFELNSNHNSNSIPVNTTIKKNLLATNIRFFNNNTIVLVGDNKIIGLDNDGNTKWIKHFKNIKVHSLNISSRNYILLEVSKPRKLLFKDRKIQVINSEGELQGKSITLKSPVVNIDAFKNYFLVNDSENIYSILKGNLICKYIFDKDVEYVKGFKDKAQILVKTEDGIEVIKSN